MAWLDWAIDDPAPANQCGYGILGIPREIDPSLRRGQVVHSVEGWFTYVSPSGVMLARGNSWGVTIMRSGQVWRHRPRPTWVNWHAGGPAQNVGTDGIEMEGKDQPWTEAQRASLVRVLQEAQDWLGWPAYRVAGLTSRTQEGIRQALILQDYGSLWEHNWFDYTTCPSGRNDWPWLIPALEEDDVMALLTQQERDDFLSTINHFVVVTVPELQKDMDHLHEHGRSNRDRIINLHGKIDAIRKEVKAIGSGSGPRTGTWKSD